MGSMLVRKFTESGMVAPADITASSKSGISARALADKTGISAVPSNASVARNEDVLYICVKPLEVRAVFQEIQSKLKPDVLLVSIAACVSLADLRDWTGDQVPCVRIIPSVTAEENAGISLVAWGPGVRPEDKKLVLSLPNAIGTAVEIDEQDFDLFTDLTSCGPALIVAMVREFAGAAVRTGTIPPGMAEYLVKETMTGTARILDGKRVTFCDVIERVATKGGSTEEGVKVLQSRLPDVMNEVLEALHAKRRIVVERIAASAKSGREKDAEPAKGGKK
jgi:pyrroline-5-carboxylate reductase